MPTPTPGTSFNIGSLLKNLNPLTQYAVRNPAWNRSGPTLKPSSAPGLSGMVILNEVPGVLERGGDAARKFYELGKGVIERRPWNEVRNNFMQPTEFKNTGIMQNLADRAANEIIYSGKEALSGHIPYTGRGVSSLPPGYTPPGSPAAERAYASELSSVAQQAAQNPMLQQYQNLRTSDPAAAQDLGMRIWAEKHRGLAENVKPGQSGYDVIQQVLAGQAPKVSGVVSEPWNTGLPLSGTPAPIPGYNMQQSLGTEIPMDEETLARLRGVAFDPAQMFGYRPE